LIIKIPSTIYTYGHYETAFKNESQEFLIAEEGQKLGIKLA